MTRKTRVLAALGLFSALLGSRLCHLDILWVEEAYPSAAALQMLDGKMLYRDVWYDKPPLSAAVYLLWGAHAGLPLRIAGTLFLLVACLLAWRFAEQLWGPREGLAAASLLAFFFIFGIPSSLLVLGPDLLMLVPHLAAVWLAWRRKPFWGGLAAGIAFLFNAKGLFVLVACILFCPQTIALLLAGFLLPNLVTLGILAFQGAVAAYWQQVWQWGFLYARDKYFDQPLWTGILKTLRWSGFHAALVLGAATYLLRKRESNRLRFAGWMLLSLIAVAAGWRFFPRYYFQILPVAVLIAARGYVLLGRARAILLLALLVPLIRFGPRYVTLADDLMHHREHQWSDLKMGQDSHAAALAIERLARPGDTLLVWGYRPEVFVYTRMPAGTRFLDSQPLTGVLADRHLTRSDVAAPLLAANDRRELRLTAPTFIVDGLGLFNPSLAIARYTDLSLWLSNYREVARTASSIIYKRPD